MSLSTASEFFTQQIIALAEDKTSPIVMQDSSSTVYSPLTEALQLVSLAFTISLLLFQLL